MNMNPGQEPSISPVDPRMRCQRPSSSYTGRIYRNPNPGFRSHSWRNRTYTSQNRIRPTMRPWMNTTRYRMPFQPRQQWDGNPQPHLQDRDNPNQREMPYHHQYSGPRTPATNPRYQGRSSFINLPFVDQDQDEKYVPMPVSHALSRSNIEQIYRNPYGELPPRRRTVFVTSEDEDEEYYPEPVGPQYTRTRSYESTSRTNSSSSFADEESAMSEGNDSSSDFPVFSNRPFIKTSLLKYPANPVLPEGCSEDSESFLEMYVAAVTQYVPVGEKKTERKAAFGVWFSPENDLNFAELLPEVRPQCLKAVLLFGSGKGIGFMKQRGFSRIKINMESDFLIKNVANWTEKFMDDACKGEELKKVENWDEYKYAEEIKQLCRSFQGMIVKWSHGSCQQEGIQAAKRMSREVLASLAYQNEDFKLYESNTKNTKN